MKIQDGAKAIEESFTQCAQCVRENLGRSIIDTWPDADAGEHVAYFPRLALYAGICGLGHINEFYLPEVKAGEIVAHDVTERTLGHYVAQSACEHKRQQRGKLEDGQHVVGEGGETISGPCEVVMCAHCGLRRPAPKVILPEA